MSEHGEHSFSGPEDDGEEFSVRDEDFIPEEEILALLQEDQERLDVTIPKEAYEEIYEFLTKFGVKGTDPQGTGEVELLWSKLLKSPSLVKDFVYTVSDVKRMLLHSEYPRTLEIHEITQYAENFDRPLEVRIDLIKRTSGKIKELGFNERQYMEQAWSGPRAEQIRFFGWIVNQPFMGDLAIARQEFQEKYDVDKLELPHLRAIVMFEVERRIKQLKKFSANYYEGKYDLHAEAKAVHESVITAMEGIYRMCGVFLTKPDQDR